MSKFSSKIQEHWQQPYWLFSLVLLPLSYLFAFIAFTRSYLFKKGILKQNKLSVPVVVIGNINVGGVGKTPVLIHLATTLQNKGIKVGIISRGYGRESKETLLVNPQGDANQYGDEPLMIAKKTGLPVAVSSSRYDAGKLLQEKYPDLELILSDDGLQHYALQRTLEIVVVSEKLGFGNAHLLPQGPLREPIKRLQTADALVRTDAEIEQNFHLNKQLESISLPTFHSSLNALKFYSLKYSNQEHSISELMQHKKIAALAGIGAPQKFFDTLHNLRVTPTQYITFPDHHIYQIQDIPQGFDIILTTEKDAVKLAQFDIDNVWVLAVDVTITPNITDWLLQNLKEKQVITI